MNLLYDIEFSCIINSNREQLTQDLIKSLPEIDFFWNIPISPAGYSEMINKAIIKCPTEYCIFLSDKARPQSSKSFYKIIQLLKAGYGLVGLYALGFFGIQKEVFRRVGFFDERFLGGGQEDMDYLFRLNESNIAYYYDLEVPYLNIPSSWPPSDHNRALLSEKWSTIPNLCLWPSMEFKKQQRRLEEVRNYNGELGPSTGVKFLDNTFTIHHK